MLKEWVKIVETGEVFPTLSACALKLAANRTTLEEVLNSQRTYKGYHIRNVRECNKKNKFLYIRLRKGTDEPVAVASSHQELAWMLGISKSAVTKGISRGSRLYAVVPDDDID